MVEKAKFQRVLMWNCINSFKVVLLPILSLFNELIGPKVNDIFRTNVSTSRGHFHSNNRSHFLNDVINMLLHGAVGKPTAGPNIAYFSLFCRM